MRKLGDDPISSGRQPWFDTAHKRVQFRLKQAIEKEVRHHQVVARRWRNNFASVYFMQGDASARLRREPAHKNAQHRRADIDHIGFNLRVQLEQPGQKPPISIAQNQGMTRASERRQKVKAASLQRSSEGRILQPAVWPCQQVEI